MALFVLILVGVVVAQTWLDWRDTLKKWVFPNWAKGTALAGVIAASLTAITSFASVLLQEPASQSPAPTPLQALLAGTGISRLHDGRDRGFGAQEAHAPDAPPGSHGFRRLLARRNALLVISRLACHPESQPPGNANLLIGGLFAPGSALSVLHRNEATLPLMSARNFAPPLTAFRS